MTTEHTNFLTVISKEVALHCQTAANLLKDAIFDSITTSCNNQHLRLSRSGNDLLRVLLHVKVNERPGI